MLRVALIGMGKMGLSHYSIFNAHPGVEVVGVSDSSGFILGFLERNTGVQVFDDAKTMLQTTRPDAVVIATPTRSHVHLAKLALESGAHVFCEKPLTLTAADSEELASIALARGLVTQVGYHNRYLGTFLEVRRLLDLGAIGRVTHGLIEAYGPVVVKAQGTSWRRDKREGGGALFDYAAHAINIVNWYMGEPSRAAGSALGRIFSAQSEDQVASTLFFDDGSTVQVSVDWSDESTRKMTTRLTLWGTEGRIFVDRQECQVYLRGVSEPPQGYVQGWNVRYITELTAPVDFYVRGEEYSAQVDDFVKLAQTRDVSGRNSFLTSVQTDRTLSLITADATAPKASDSQEAQTPVRRQKPATRWRFSWRFWRRERAARQLGGRAT